MALLTFDEALETLKSVSALYMTDLEFFWRNPDFLTYSDYIVAVRGKDIKGNHIDFSFNSFLVGRLDCTLEGYLNLVFSEKMDLIAPLDIR